MRAILFFLLCKLFILSSSAQSWVPATPPPNFFSDHSFGFALDGKGYLVAGTEEMFGKSAAFFQFDPQEDEWTILDSFPGDARGFAIGDVWDGKAYFGFGAGPDSLLRDLWVFDPDSMKWAQLASCPCQARTHPAFVANNGKIFVGLGSGSNGNMNDWWEYDITSDQWSQKPDFPDLKRHHPYQFAVGDYVYTGLGHGAEIFNDWYRYDPKSEMWDRMADLPGEGRVAGTQFSFGGKGYVLSGDGEDHLSMDEGEFWEYDPDLDAWNQLPSHPGRSRWAPASFIIDGEVYLFNGTTYFEGQGFFYMEEAFKFKLVPKTTYPHFERVVSHLYESTIYDAVPLSNGRWALAVKDLQTPFMIWEDSLSIVILDSTGSVINRIEIDPVLQNEITEMGPVWALPNGELVLKYGVGNCDAGVFGYVLQKFDVNGVPVWHLPFDETYLPVSLALSPDSNLLYNAIYSRMKIDINSGEIIWQHGTGSSNFRSMQFVPGTEDIIAGDTSGIKYYSKMVNGDVVSYELSQSHNMDLGDGTFQILGQNTAGVFFGMNSESKELFRFRKDLQPALVMVIPEGANEFYNQYDFSDQHIAIGINFPDLEVRLYDTLGQFISTYENQRPGLQVNDLKLSGNGVSLFGHYRSGPTAEDYPDFIYPNGREQGWIRFYPNAEEDSLQIHSLSVVDIEQLELPAVDSFFSPGPTPGTLYNITGGRFRIQVLNTGNVPVESFYINTVFNERINYWFCGPVSAGFKYYDNTSLDPGESIWVEFEDLLAQDQNTLPPQFCFWTSANNHLPDDMPEDDLHCIDNLVATYSQQPEFLQVYPNPADEELMIKIPSEYAGSNWSLVDVYGRILLGGDNLYASKIDVTELPAGFYFLMIGSFSKKIIINHY